MPDPETIGRRLGHYRILNSLGEGGMGQVYRARDERLGRDVALKILPPGLLEDGAARRRFARESRALGRVNHPHVATLFDAARSDGVDFLVMELVPGPTLDEELRRRRLTEEEVVRLSAQLVRGLQAAHELGVVHRDIKPSNVALTSDGLVKVLDFGLAHLAPHDAADDEARTETAAGVAAGSPPYMSPEQLMGRAVDARSDLYSVGALMYEMVTRQRLFGTLKGVELTDAILHRSPPSPREAGAHVSAGLEFVILKLVDKDPGLRYQTARELLVDLERLDRGLDVATTGKPLRSPWISLGRRWPLALGVAGLAVAVAVGLVSLVSFGRRPVPRGTAGPFVGTPQATVVPLTSSPGSERHPALSPSGRRLAYVAGPSDTENAEIHVQEVGSHQSVALTSSHVPECCIAWAPDERSLAFVRMIDGDGALIEVSAGGGIERRLGDLTPWFGTALSISPDGRTLAYTSRDDPREPFSVRLLSLETLETRRLTDPPAGILGDGFPSFSPDGRWVAFARLSVRIAAGNVFVAPAEGGAARPLTSMDGLFIGDLDWSADGRTILFWAELREGVAFMWQVGLDGGEPALHWPRGAPLAPRRFSEAEGLSSVSSAFRFSVARETGQIALTRSTYDTDIWELPMGDEPPAGGPPGPLISSTQTDESPQLSPDGSRIAIASLRSGDPQIWLCDRAGSSCVPLLTASTHDGTPRWSPDGARIVFDARPVDGLSDIYVIDVATRFVRRLTTHPANDAVASWSRDGQWIYFASRRTGPWEIFKVSANGGEPRQVTTNGGFATFESVSGDRLYFTRYDTPGLWSIPVEGGPERKLLDQPRCWGHWAVGRKGPYVVSAPSGQPAQLLLLPPGGEATPLATLPRSLPCGESALTVSLDGREVLYAGIRESSDLVLVREIE